MRILVLADGRVGHLRQARALAALAASTEDAEIAERIVEPRKVAGDRVRMGLSWMAWLRPEKLLARCYGIDADEVRGFDLVIGCGRPVLLAGMLIARATDARFIFCGRDAGYDVRDIALALVQEGAEGRLPRHVVAPLPSPVLPERWPSPRLLASQDDFAGAQVTLLVGGPSEQRGWSFPEWLQLAYLVVEAENRLGVRWSIATSRRTPEVARDLLASAFDALGQPGQWIDYAVSGLGSADDLMGADVICVTADSIAMIADGLAAMRPVLAIGSHRLRRSHEDGILAELARSGSFTEVPLAGLDAEAVGEHLLRLRAPSADPRAALLAALQPVLQGLR